MDLSFLNNLFGDNGSDDVYGQSSKKQNTELTDEQKAAQAAKLANSVGTGTSLFGTGVALVGAGVNQYQANKDMKKNLELQQQAHSKNLAEKARNTYRDSAESPTAKGLMTNTKRAVDSANTMRDTRNVAGNMTFNNRLAAKKATNDTMANTFNNAVQAQEAREARESENFINRELGLNRLDQKYNTQQELSRANNVANYTKAGAELATSAVGGAPKALANKNNVNDEDEEDTAGNQFKSLNRSLFNTLGEPINPVSQPNEDSTQNAMAWNWLNNHSSKSISNRLNKGMFGNNLG